MLLRNLKIVENDIAVSVGIQNGKISAVHDFVNAATDEPAIYFDDVICFPGLINSHDHLDFNLFPQLGNRVYCNYVEWGNDIHQTHKETINNVLQIPKHLRFKWGVYKNLVNGVTTVVNHGTLPHISNEMITVFQEYHFLHSIQLEKDWKFKLNQPLRKSLPFVIHIGEGTDKESHDEIDALIKWNILKRNIVGVHGIAMSEKQASSFIGMVWCPVANFFLIGKTAAIDKLKQKTYIVFGTDSTLSAGWNIWDHLRMARSQNMVSDKELYNMLTVLPANLWKIHTGKIEVGYDADIVVARRKDSQHNFDAYYATNPEDILLVTHKGDIRLFDSTLLNQLVNNSMLIENFHKIAVKHTVKYIYGDLPELMREIKYYYKDICFPFESI